MRAELRPHSTNSHDYNEVLYERSSFLNSGSTSERDGERKGERESEWERVKVNKTVCGGP